LLLVINLLLLVVGSLMEPPAAILVLMLLVALLAPWLGTVDPALIDVSARNLKPGELLSITLSDASVVDHTAYFGTDNLGRDIFSRVLYGTRVSLIIGAAVAMISLTIGLLIGLLAGFFRRLDGPVMRVMDALMAIPGILLAITLVAIWKGGMLTVTSYPNRTSMVLRGAWDAYPP
jgi:peptide/nickel transport system permease protein